MKSLSVIYISRLAEKKHEALAIHSLVCCELSGKILFLANISTIEGY